MRVLVRVPFGAQPDHHHISLLEFAGTTVLVGRCFNFVGVYGKPVAYLSMESSEVRGECDGLGGVCARIR